jgi:hypothetical protein
VLQCVFFIDRSFAAELVERSRNNAVPADSSSIVAAGKSTILDLNLTTVPAENSNLKCGQGEHTRLHGHVNGNNVDAIAVTEEIVEHLS